MANGQRKSDWIESLKQFPGIVRGVILYITGITGFILFFRENAYINIIVIVISSALAGILLCVYILFKRNKPLIEGGKGVYSFEKYRPWAMGGIVAITGEFVFFIVQIERAFPTTTITATSTNISLSSAPMVEIGGGIFIRGSNDLRDAIHEKVISIHTFWIDVYEVTNEDYSIRFNTNQTKH